MTVLNENRRIIVLGLSVSCRAVRSLPAEILHHSQARFALQEAPAQLATSLNTNSFLSMVPVLFTEKNSNYSQVSQVDDIMKTKNDSKMVETANLQQGDVICRHFFKIIFKHMGVNYLAENVEAENEELAKNKIKRMCELSYRARGKKHEIIFFSVQKSSKK